MTISNGYKQGVLDLLAVIGTAMVSRVQIEAGTFVLKTLGHDVPPDADRLAAAVQALPLTVAGYDRCDYAGETTAIDDMLAALRAAGCRNLGNARGLRANIAARQRDAKAPSLAPETVSPMEPVGDIADDDDE